MVATSLPFWMHHPSRTMSHFSTDKAVSAEAEARGGTSTTGRSAAGQPIVVEIVESDVVTHYEAAWSALAARALEPNVFAEPGFALPAMLHFAPAERPHVVLVWSDDEAGNPVLVGLCALRKRGRLQRSHSTAAWHHEQATVAAPLLDRDRAPEVLEALLDWFAARSAQWGGLALQGIASDGALMRLLSEPGRYQVAVLARRTRAVLRHASAGKASGPAPKHLKEMRRQRRRLADTGVLAFASARSLDEVKAATERFLDLEARGWKGGRGTALLNDPGLAAFTRAMTRRLARQGLCHIDSLDIEGRPAAMGIVIGSGDRAYFWKTAYDEAQHRYSPGKQFADLLGEAQLAEQDVALTDSCAIAGHPMIDRLWTDRMTVVDLLVAGRQTSPSSLERAARTIGLWRGLRQSAKGLRDKVRALLKRR